MIGPKLGEEMTNSPIGSDDLRDRSVSTATVVLFMSPIG